jgi:prepilin-type N-terminal cleavage/methylation domain-containing protein
MIEAEKCQAKNPHPFPLSPRKKRAGRGDLNGFTFSPRKKRAGRGDLNGFTLIEVLISLLLLSLMLLGFDAMGIFGHSETRSAYYYTQAVNQIFCLEERLRALNVHDGLENQIEIWNKENQTVLPNALGSVTGIYPTYTITLFWGESQTDCPHVRVGQSGCVSEKITL